MKTDSNFRICWVVKINEDTQKVKLFNALRNKEREKSFEKANKQKTTTQKLHAMSDRE